MKWLKKIFERLKHLPAPKWLTDSLRRDIVKQIKHLAWRASEMGDTDISRELYKVADDYEQKLKKKIEVL
jgi:hypothetical protein